MNKLFGLALVPLGLLVALSMPCPGPQAGQQNNVVDSRSIQVDVGGLAAIRQARVDLGDRLLKFERNESPASAMELFEALLVVEGLQEHRTRRFDSFGPHNLPDCSSAARTHFVLGSELAGLPVVPVRKGTEPDYWELDAVLQASSDPWFEFDLAELYARLVRRAGRMKGNGSKG